MVLIAYHSLSRYLRCKQYIVVNYFFLLKINLKLNLFKWCMPITCFFSFLKAKLKEKKTFSKTIQKIYKSEGKKLVIFDWEFSHFFLSLSHFMSVSCHLERLTPVHDTHCMCKVWLRSHLWWFMMHMAVSRCIFSYIIDQVK